MISVIIPIYNVEKYLRQCLESVINQNYKEYEVILVNDGSTDSSKNIAIEFCKKYSNIKFIDKANGGLSSARNAGLEVANGEYIVFIDSDDYIRSDYLEKLYQSISQNDSDISICNLVKVYEKKGEEEEGNLDVNCIKCYSNVDVLKMIFEGKIFCYAWDKIYKKSLFIENNIRYPEGRLYEDIFTTIRLISYSRKIKFVNEPLYFYRIRKGNITSIKSDKAIKDYNYAIKKVNEFFDIHTNIRSNIENEIINFNMLYTLSSLDMLATYCNYNKREFYETYSNIYRKELFDYGIKQVMKNKKIAKWIKRDYLLFRFGLLPIKTKLSHKKINI